MAALDMVRATGIYLNISFRGDEFVDIFNRGPADADIGGWVLDAGKKKTGTKDTSYANQQFVFPKGTTLKAGSSIRVWTRAKAGRDYSFTNRTNIWLNSGDTGKLIAADGSVVSIEAFEDDAKTSKPLVSIVGPDPGDFGTVEIGKSKELTFRIENHGTTDLRMEGKPLVDIVGKHKGEFTVKAPPVPVPSVPPNGYTTFTVVFRPTSATPKTKSAQISIANNDETNNACTHAIKGTTEDAKVPKLELASTLKKNKSGVYNFGEVAVTAGGQVATFTIKNTGTAPLVLDVPFTTNPQPSKHYAVSPPLDATIAPQGKTTFTVTFDPDSGGNKPFSVEITYRHDGKPHSETVGIDGTGEGPEIDVLEGKRPLADNNWTHDFQQVDIRASSDVTFTIRNRGKLDELSVTDVTITGANVKDFSVKSSPAKKLKPAERTTFDVRFSPMGAGERIADLHIANNDADENPYDIHLKGIGKLSRQGAARDVCMNGEYDAVVRLGNGDVYQRRWNQRWNRTMSGVEAVLGCAGGLIMHEQPHLFTLILKTDGSLWSLYGNRIFEGGIIDGGVYGSTGAVLRDDGTVWVSNSPTSASSYIKIPDLTGADSVAVGYQYVFALKSDGSIWRIAKDPEYRSENKWDTSADRIVDDATCMAIYNANAETFLGYLTKSGQLVRKAFGGPGRMQGNCPSPANAKYAAYVDQDFPAVITQDGYLWTQGRNINFRLGHGRWAATVGVAKVDGLGPVKAATGNGSWSLAVGQDGRLYEWGKVEYTTGADLRRNPYRYLWPAAKSTLS